jgi:hypothetical protein
MKARIKATGEIVEAELKGFDNLNVEHYIINGNQNWVLSEFSLEFLESDLYWTRLEHQYAGMAMQQLVSIVNAGYEYVYEETAIIAMNFAHALVQKLKESK